MILITKELMNNSYAISSPPGAFPITASTPSISLTINKISNKLAVDYKYPTLNITCRGSVIPEAAFPKFLTFISLANRFYEGVQKA